MKRQFTFHPWVDAVLRVQIRTFTLAREMMGINLSEHHGLVMRGNSNSPLMTFRALRPYRTQQAIALRNNVAREILKKRGWKHGNV